MSRRGLRIRAVRTNGATVLTLSTSGPSRTPALWMTASNRPYALACSASATVSSRFARSAHSAPRMPSRNARSAKRDALRACTTTSWPSAANACAVANPSPLAAPVTRVNTGLLHQHAELYNAARRGLPLLAFALRRGGLVRTAVQSQLSRLPTDRTGNRYGTRSGALLPRDVGGRVFRIDVSRHGSAVAARHSLRPAAGGRHAGTGSSADRHRHVRAVAGRHCPDWRREALGRRPRAARPGGALALRSGLVRGGDPPRSAGVGRLAGYRSNTWRRRSGGPARRVDPNRGHR